MLAFALATAIGATSRRVLPSIGAALVGFLFLFVATDVAVRYLTPVSRAAGPRGTPATAWDIGSGRYHPAAQFWPLQLAYVAMLLALAVVALALGWRATRARQLV